MNYIPLGSDCSLAYQLSKLGKRKEALPFDWVLTPKLNKIIDLIDNQFEDLFDHLVYKNQSNSFPLIEDDFISIPSSTLRVYNPKYHLTFVHDFSSEDDLDKVKDKYLRRISKFLNLLRSDQPKKIIRLGSEQEDLSYFYQFPNVEIIKINHFSSKDWKKDDYPWTEILI